MVNFKIDDTEFREYFDRFKDKQKMSALAQKCIDFVYDEAIHFVHIDTGELLMSIDKIPVRYSSSGYEGEVFATSMHGVYEENRGGDHAFMTRAEQSLDTVFDNIVEDWWNENFE